jgi:5'-phosphate synthase pdxT subunit
MIGVLALQGDVQEHLDHLARVGVAAKPVKDKADFSDLAGLILPGGESTCVARLLKIFGLHNIILDAVQRGMKIWGTCAGAILLAKQIEGERSHLGLMDITIRRNAYGSQLDSFTIEAVTPKIAPQPLPLAFIRAPKIVGAGADVDILLRLEDGIAAAEDARCLATIFHPELTPTLAFHRYFARKCGVAVTAEAGMIDPDWTPASWMKVGKA